MKKVLKIAGCFVLGLVLAVILLLAAHPLWIGAVVRNVAKEKVPEFTGTGFDLGSFGLNLYSGALRTDDVTLCNPQGFKEPRAVEIGSFDVDVDIASVFSDTIVVRDITVDGLFVSWVEHAGTNNFEQIGANVKRAGDGGKPSGAKTSAKTRAPAAEKKPEEGSGAGKKVVIDVLTLRNLKVNWMGLTIPVPTIVVRGIGRDSGGVTWSVAGEEILVAVLGQLRSLSGGLLNFGTLLKESGESVVSNSVREVSGAMRAGAREVAGATEKSAALVTDALKDGSGDVAGVATNAASILLKALKSGADAVGTGSKGAVDSTGDALKESRDALKESRDALKDLFRRGKK